MSNMRITLKSETRKELESMLTFARKRGDLRTVLRILAIFMICEGITRSVIAATLGVCQEAIRLWVGSFLLYGPQGLKSKKPWGRKSKLTKTQKKKLDQMISDGPQKAGYPGVCWRSPMIQDLIYREFGVFYSVHYICQLLKNMGFSYQKARFVSDHLDEKKRQQWLEKTWPEIYQTARNKNACILFGDEASFPQWGTLSYTWAKKGQQPTVKTSGIRKGYKVFGLIDYSTGKFFYKCQEERLNSQSYIQFLQEVIEKTNQHIILIQDGATYHTSKATKTFFEQHQEHLTVYQLPSYSPDYNPIEKLWKKIKEKGIHLHYFPTYENLKMKVQQSLEIFEDAPQEVLALFVSYNERTAA
jgi:transposase